MMRNIFEWLTSVMGKIISFLLLNEFQNKYVTNKECVLCIFGLDPMRICWGEWANGAQGARGQMRVVRIYILLCSNFRSNEWCFM